MTVDRRVKTYQSDLSLERENLGLLGLKSDLFHILRRNYTGTGHELSPTSGADCIIKSISPGLPGAAPPGWEAAVLVSVPGP